MAQRKLQWPETLDYVTAYGAYAQHETQRGFLHVSENSSWTNDSTFRKTGNTLNAKIGGQGSFRREQ
jgi:hypothetical protein